MTNDQTAEQAREEYYRILGPTLGPLYVALYNEVVWIHAKWRQFKILYADSPERIDLLNQVAGFFFRIIQDMLWQDVTLHLARLTDPPRSPGSKDNLTLQRLAGAISDPSLSKEVSRLVQQALTDSQFVRDWRNRQLAHQDLALAMKEGAVPLPTITIGKIDTALKAVGSVLNQIEGHYRDGEVAFTEFIAHGDAESLANYLKLAVETVSRQH